MSDGPATPRFSLPILAVAQAQKEMTHNEALVLIDALIHATVETGPQADPPTERAEGECWLIGADATGAWAGQEDRIGLWSAGGWRFIAPHDGMRVRRSADGLWMTYGAGLWAEPAAIANPDGGSTIDTEARIAIELLISALSTQGLVISG